jgi:hypothetical protein
MPDSGRDEEVESWRSFELSYGKRAAPAAAFRKMPLPKELVREEGFGTIKEYSFTLEGLAGPAERYVLRLRCVLDTRLLPLERRMLAEEHGLDTGTAVLEGEWSEKSDPIATCGMPVSAKDKAKDRASDKFTGVSEKLKAFKAGKIYLNPSILNSN